MNTHEEWSTAGKDSNILVSSLFGGALGVPKGRLIYFPREHALGEAYGGQYD